jgi:hypothetical protein
MSYVKLTVYIVQTNGLNIKQIVAYVTKITKEKALGMMVLCEKKPRQSEVEMVMVVEKISLWKGYPS